MMIYKYSKDQLLKEGCIKNCPVDYKAILKLIDRAYVDIETANRNLDKDNDCTYNYAYNAMLHSGLALMFNEGYRPEIKNKHLTIVQFVSLILGEKFGKLVNDYDFMRRKRHTLIYEPGIPCSFKEAENALLSAKGFVEIIDKKIKEKNPQKGLFI